MQYNNYSMGEYSIYGYSLTEPNNVKCLAIGINGEVLDYKIQELKRLGYENIYSTKTKDMSVLDTSQNNDNGAYVTTAYLEEIPFGSQYKIVSPDEVACYTADLSGWNFTGTMADIEAWKEISVPYTPSVTPVTITPGHKAANNSNNDKPTIICLVGESGTGKTTLARELNDTYNISAICSYTTRPMREGEENHVDHIFVNDEVYNKTDKADMLAYTIYGGYHYWTKHSQVRSGLNVYVIDKRGLDEFKSKWHDSYNIISVLITRDNRDNIDKARKLRDLKNPTGNDYDIIIENNYLNLPEFFRNAVDKIRAFVKKN